MRILSSRAMQVVSSSPKADSGYHCIPRPTGFTCFALPSEVSLIQADHVLQGLLRDRPNQRRYRSVSALLTKERYNIRPAMPVSRSSYPFPADDCKGRLELPGCIEIGINRFLTHDDSRPPRVSCSVASRLTHPLVETSFGPRRRGVVATDRMVFITQFPCV